MNADVTEILYHSNHNIGVAMDTPKGLVVPVIKHVSVIFCCKGCNHLFLWVDYCICSIGSAQEFDRNCHRVSEFTGEKSSYLKIIIIKSIQEIAAKGALTESHLSGGTFSLSNIGINL